MGGGVLSQRSFFWCTSIVFIRLFYSDLQGIRTSAVQDGTDWVINGSKVFITNGINSDFVIVVAGTDRSAKSPAHGISLFLVDSGTPGYTKGRNLKKLGMKSSVWKFTRLCGFGEGLEEGGGVSEF